MPPARNYFTKRQFRRFHTMRVLNAQRNTLLEHPQLHQFENTFYEPLLAISLFGNVFTL